MGMGRGTGVCMCMYRMLDFLKFETPNIDNYFVLSEGLAASALDIGVSD